MECTHRFQVDSHNVGTCSLCGEVRQFPYDKGGLVKVLKKGKLPHNHANKEETVNKAKRRYQGWNSQKSERHRYYEDNKDAIIADLLSKGRSAVCIKWKISRSSLFILEKRWLTKEQKLKIPSAFLGVLEEIPLPSTTTTNHNGRLPAFPQFSEDWPQIVKVKWLEVYGELAKH